MISLLISKFKKVCKTLLTFLHLHYKSLNITLLGLSIYVITFPIFSKILELFSPNLTKCVYKQMTLNECPLCGGTRFFSNILQNGFKFRYLFSSFGIMFLILLIELISRIILLFNCKKLTKKIIIIDLIWHIFILILYFLYLILFMLNQ